jgi:ribonuclease HII
MSYAKTDYWTKRETLTPAKSCYTPSVLSLKHRHSIDSKTIHEINILQASMKAMEVAVSKLPVQADFVLVDGNRVPKAMKPSAAECIVKGDGKSLAIAAASVIAKVVRDRMMVDLDKKYPQYGFAKHKGYGVPQHLTAIKKHGPCPEHRRTFAPIKYM